MTNVFVAVISNQDFWDAKFALSLARLCPEYIAQVDVSLGQTIAQMRNRAVLTAQENGMSHILMLDADQVYPPDIIKRLLVHDVDIVGGLYPARRQPWYLNIHMRSSSDVEYEYTYNSVYRGIRIYDMPIKGVLHVDVLGLGGALLKTELFDKLKYPYFDNVVPPYSQAEDASIIGDEFYFAHNCRAHDIPLYCDTELRYTHVANTEVVYDPDKGVRYIHDPQADRVLLT